MTERLISADSHIASNHEDIKLHLDPKHHVAYDGAVQRLQASGREMWAGKDMSNTQAHAAMKRPGYGDGAERLKDMDQDGVQAEVLYSEVSAFRFLGDLGSAEANGAATRAFNDALRAWAAPDPSRLIVSAQIPIFDIDFAVEEIQRVIGLGFKSLQLPVYPSEYQLPEYYDDRYAPMWSVIEQSGLPVCLHIGLNTNLKDLVRRDPTPNAGIMVPQVGLTTAESFGMLVMGGVFERFPGLKVVYVEPGLGWIPWWLETVDDMAVRQGYQFPAIKELPSFYFKRNCHITFIDEATAVQTQRHQLGVENILWSTDYPHPVSTWPHSRKIVDEVMQGVPAEERQLMVAGNAERLWNLT